MSTGGSVPTWESDDTESTPAYSGGTITADEAADLLRVSGRSVRRWLKDGELAGFRAGRQWRIPRDEFEKKFSVSTAGIGTEE